MNWKLTQKCVNSPRIDDWSGWLEEEPDHVLSEIPTDAEKFSTLDLLFGSSVSDDAVEKLAPGVYWVRHDGWL
jgi:hypothetical protein